MNIKLKPIYVFSLLLIWNCSCSNNSHIIHHGIIGENMIKLTERNDLKITGTIIHPLKDESNYRHTNFQIGYSPINHIGIKGGHSRLLSGEIRSITINQLNAYHIALGGYYFSPKKRTKKRRRRKGNDLKIQPGWLIEFYSGFEFMKLNNTLTTFLTPTFFNKFVRANFEMKKFYLEPSFQLQKKRFGFSSSIKYSSLVFKKGVINGGAVNTLSLFRHFLTVREDNHHHLFETNFTVTMGNNLAKGHLGSGINLLGNKSTLSSTNLVIYAGLNLSLDFFYQQKQQKRRRSIRRRRK